MIWIWISAAILISVFLLRGRHISFENYIWILLPVDMYGLNVAGVTLKPYMIFCGIILFIHIKDLFTKGLFTGSRIVPFIFLGALLVNTFNGGTTSSLMAIFMVILVYLCASIYMSNMDEHVREIPEVIVATSIGYGFVFLVAYLLFSAGIVIPGIFARTSLQPGIIMGYDNMGGNVFSTVYRLRGFNIDPNASVGIFLSALSINVIVLLMKQTHKGRYLISFALCLVSIYLSNSRMGILTSIGIMFLSGIKAIKMTSIIQRRRIIRNVLIVLSLVVVVLLSSNVMQKLINEIISSYEGRSDFNAQYGRGSIWKESLSVWQDKGLLFGIGTGNIRYLISTGKQTHNTWLEWLCGCGILVGSAVIIWFIILILQGFNAKIAGTDDDKILFQAIFMGLLGMVICLITVDNTTNSFLWFFAVSFTKILSSSDRFVSNKPKYRYLKS